MKRLLSILFATALLAGGFALPAQAELARMSPADVAAGTFPFPLWIEDANGLRLAPCTDPTVCLEGGTIPAFPGDLVDPLLGFEVIYFAAETGADVGVGADGLNPARVRIIMAVEALPDELDPNVPVLSNGILVRIDNALAGDYRVTLPYDVDHDDDPATPKVAEVTLTPVANRVLGEFPPHGLVAATLPTSITDALTGPVGPFLRASATPGGAPTPFATPATGGTFLFDGGLLEAETAVTGSPTGRNFARIIGPAGFGDRTFDTFVLFGQLPDVHDRRAELNTKTGKIQVSGTSLLVPPATLTIATEEAVPQVLTPTPVPVRADGSFRFTTNAPRLLPAAGGAVGREVKALRITPQPGVGQPVAQPTVTPLVIR
jgi:hypothetical protein